MQLSEYQRKTSETAVYPDQDIVVNELTDDIFTTFNSMISKMGIITNAVKKTIRDDDCQISTKRLAELNNGLTQLASEIVKLNKIVEYPPIRDNEETSVKYDGERIARLYTSTGIIDEGCEYFEKCNAIKGSETEQDLMLIEDELGDIEWYINQSATCIYGDIEKICKRNLKKLNKRKEDGVLGGDGDIR